jgi:hypothetical protein
MPTSKTQQSAYEKADAAQTYDDLVKLARTCARQAKEMTNPSVSAELMRMAKHYQLRAAELDGGKLPDIGEDVFGADQFHWTGRYLWGKQRLS